MLENEMWQRCPVNKNFISDTCNYFLFYYFIILLFFIIYYLLFYFYFIF